MTDAAPPDISIEPAGESDIPVAREILLAATARLLAKGIAQWRAEDFREERVMRWIGELYLARRRSLAVGCLRLGGADPDVWPELTALDGPWMALHSLAVRPDHAGSGVGRTMLELAAEEARRRGAEVLRLDCWAENHRLRRYYTDAGFAYVGNITIPVPSGAYVAAKFERGLL